jgi:hypothetical protein
MSDIDPRIDRKTPLPEPEARRGVFGSRKFWFLSMEWSIIVFVVTLGLTALLWVYLTGADRTCFRSPCDAWPRTMQW